MFELEKVYNYFNDWLNENLFIKTKRHSAEWNAHFDCLTDVSKILYPDRWKEKK